MYRLITAGCVLALGLLLPLAGTGQEGADNPAAKNVNRDNQRHKDFLNRIEQTKGEGDVIFLGDSITEGWERPKGKNSKEWDEHFGAFKPVNLGIGGDVTGHVLSRITEGHEIDKLNPKAAVIMIGTNNTGGHTAPQIAGGVKAIVDELKRQKPTIKILLLGVFPRGNPNDAVKTERTVGLIAAGVAPINEELKKTQPDLKRLDMLVQKLQPQKGTIPAEKLNKKIPEINAILATYHDGKSVFYKDIGKEFLDQNGGLSGEIMNDYLHLTPQGYDIWGKAIKGDIAKLVK